MKEKFEQLHQSVLELIGNLHSAKTDNLELQRTITEQNTASRVLEEKLSYQEKLIEALQVESKQLHSDRELISERAGKIEDLLAIIEQAQTK